MNLFNIQSDKKNFNKDSFNLGGALGLWDMARNKIILSTVYVVYYKQIKDSDLKKMMHTRLTRKLPNQLARIQQIFREKAFGYPVEPNWERKMKDDSPFILSTMILDDEEIALSIREHLRAVISIETEALRNAVMPDTRKLIFDILQEDNDAYSDLIKLIKKKNWMDFPPALKPQ